MVKHPKFQRPNRSIDKRVKDTWRKPRGIDNKQRQKLKWAGAVVNKGYRGDALVRGLHPLGKKEFMIRGLPDFEKNKAVLKNYVIRLSATISKHNKEKIRRKAAEMKFIVLN
ncbi:MAG: eL32 family ribosomal protein [Candidatus Micrarchaeota archaeon]